MSEHIEHTYIFYSLSTAINSKASATGILMISRFHFVARATKASP